MRNTDHRAAPGGDRPSLMAADRGAESRTPESSRVLADLGAQAAKRRRRVAAAWLCSAAFATAAGIYWSAHTPAGDRIGANAQAPRTKGATVIAVAEALPPIAPASSSPATENASREVPADQPVAVAQSADANPDVASASVTGAAPSNIASAHRLGRAHAGTTAKQTVDTAPQQQKPAREVIKSARAPQPQLASERTRAVTERAKSTSVAKASTAAKPRKKSTAAVRSRPEPDPDIDLLAAILRRSGEGANGENVARSTSSIAGRRELPLIP